MKKLKLLKVYTVYFDFLRYPINDDKMYKKVPNLRLLEDKRHEFLYNNIIDSICMKSLWGYVDKGGAGMV